MLNKLRMPLHVLLAEERNGECHIVAFRLVSTEDVTCIKEMTGNNGEWIKTVDVMSDKYFTEQYIFKYDLVSLYMPRYMHICMAHVLQLGTTSIIFAGF